MTTQLPANWNASYSQTVSPKVEVNKQPKEKVPGERSPKPAGVRNMTRQQSFKSATQPLQKQGPQPEAEAFRVYVRIRPMSQREINNLEPGKQPNIIQKQDNMIYVSNPNKFKDLRPREEKFYAFDDVFQENDSTADIYSKALTSTLDNVINGYNTTLFAYGMTGAGKTYTMFGNILGSEEEAIQTPGLISLMVKDLLAQMNSGSFQMKISYLEIYNEQVRDLLSKQSNESLMIIEDPSKGVIVPNLSSYEVKEYKDVLDLIFLGNSKRVMASNTTNQFSSRSHAIIQVYVEKIQKAVDDVETCIQSKLCLVDLAGSERASVSDNKGIRQMEGANINRSLLALGNCINILSDPNSKGAFVPYRDSKLTRLLKDSLGGNTKTIMIGCISPSYLAYEETLNTLKYTCTARNIKRNVVKNVKEVEMQPSQYKDIIENLKMEIETLQKQLYQQKIPTPSPQGVLHPSSEFNSEIETTLTGLTNKLLLNIEQNYELNQAYKELRDLEAQNIISLRTKMTDLEKVQPKSEDANRLSQEIVSLQGIMKENNVLQAEIEENLRKNLQEKKILQERIVNLTSKNTQTSQGNLPYFFGQIPQTFELPKLDEDGGSPKEGQNAVQEKLDKDDKILSLEKYIQYMETKLEEKDRILEQNKELLSVLSKQNEKVDINKGRGPAKILNTGLSKKTGNQAEARRGRDDNNSYVIAGKYGTELSGKSLESLDNSGKKEDQIKCFDNQSSIKQSSFFEKKEEDETRNKSSVPLIEDNNRTLSELSCITNQATEQSLDLSPRNLFMGSINSTGNQPAKQISKFGNKSNLVQKEEKPKNNVNVSDTKPSTASNTRDLNKKNIRPSDLASTNNKTNIGPNDRITRKTSQQPKPRSNLPPTGPSKASVNQTSGQSINMSKEKVDNANLKADLEANGLSPEPNDVDKVQQGSKSKVAAQSHLYRSLSPNLTAGSSPSKRQLDLKSKKSIPNAVMVKSKTLHAKGEKETDQRESEQVSIQTQQTQQTQNSQIQGNSQTQIRLLTDSYVENDKSPVNGTKDNNEEPRNKRSGSSIRSLSMAREITKNFRLRLNNLALLVENNMVGQPVVDELVQLVQEYHTNKSLISNNDYLILKSIGAKVLQKANQNEPAKATNIQQPHQTAERTPSVNRRARNNLGTPFEENNSPNKPIVKKEPEIEKRARKIEPNIKDKSGTANDAKSGFSRGQSRFDRNVKRQPEANKEQTITSKNEKEKEKARPQTQTEKSEQRSFKNLNKAKTLIINGAEALNERVKTEEEEKEITDSQVKLKVQATKHMMEQEQRKNLLRNRTTSSKGAFASFGPHKGKELVREQRENPRAVN